MSPELREKRFREMKEGLIDGVRALNREVLEMIAAGKVVQEKVRRHVDRNRRCRGPASRPSKPAS